MSKGRVVAIYHRETRKVLGHIPCEVITKQTEGRWPKFAIAYRNPNLFNVDGPRVTTINYDVVHDAKGMPIKVIADSQRDAYILIESQKPTTSELLRAIISEPNPILEGLRA